MRLHIRVSTKASCNKICESDAGMRAYLTVAPEAGKANALLIQLLSDYFKVPKSAIKIVKGALNRDKIVDVDR